MWGIAIYALIFCGFIAFLFRSRWFGKIGIPRTWFVLAFAIKAVVGGMFYWVYTAYYTNQTTQPDAFRYVHDAQLIADVLPEKPEVFAAIMLGYPSDDPAYRELTEQMIGWHGGYLYGLTNDCSTVIRLNVPIALFAKGSFMVHALIFGILSFMGCVWLFLAANPFIQERFHRIAWALVFLSPTQLFWTCSPTKEAALMPVFGGLFYVFSLWHRQQLRVRQLWWCLLIAPGLVLIKQYVLYAILPGMLYYLVQRLWKTIRPLYLWLVVMLVCAVIADNAHHFFLGGDFLYVIQKKLTDFNNLAALQQAGSWVYVAPTPTWIEFGLHYPAAFAQSYLRPWIWECKSWIYIPFAVENALVLGLLVYSAWRLPFVNRANKPFLVVVITTIVVMAAILGNTVPILGAVIRYRTPGLLLLFLLCLMLWPSHNRPITPEKERLSKPLGN